MVFLLWLAFSWFQKKFHGLPLGGRKTQGLLQLGKVVYFFF